ncbi:hypothetical protein [Chryseobacterium koreense]|nr:hypothetical protein [Chryseobacterium koreense]MBB5333449.1 hypothetical protein [Chryseobacterium koreense]
MKNKLILFFTAMTVISCSFLQNTMEYKETSKKFMNTLLNKSVDESIPYFAMESETAKDANVEEMKNGLENFRQKFITLFGKNIEYDFMSSQKRFSTEEKNNTPPNSTIVLMQFKNEKDFGVLQFLFDDKSKKILNVTPLDVKYPIPNMTLYYVLGVLALIVTTFNIYMINKIRKSGLKRKWLKYIAIILLNFPTFIYNPVTGFSFKLFQFTFIGFGFSAMGYLNSSITIGVPVAAIYWYWKLKQKENKKVLQPTGE